MTNLACYLLVNDSNLLEWFDTFYQAFLNCFARTNDMLNEMTKDINKYKKSISRYRNASNTIKTQAWGAWGGAGVPNH